MLFTLEALDAAHGDSLILHYGEPDSPRFVVIDGGPNGVFGKSLRPRLKSLHDEFAIGGKLDIEMVIVSHIDDDHINGILDWFVERRDSPGAMPMNILGFWHNSFDDLLGNRAEDMRSRLAGPASTAAVASMSTLGSAVVASVMQGRQLRDLAKALGLPTNAPFKGLVMPQKGKPRTTVTLDDDLKLHVVAPLPAQLEALLKKWDEDVAKNPDVAEVAAFADRSAANLSSLVVVAEFSGKTMLLTGDARGDFVIDGLEGSGFLTGGKAHFDVMKVPHHGSNRNVTQGFFREITAGHYVISADGKHRNPDGETIEMIAKGRGGADYTLHLTNEKMVDEDGFDVGNDVKDKLTATKGIATKRKVVFGAKGGHGVKTVAVNLLDPIVA